MIAPGGVTEVAETLERAQVIDSQFRFKTLVWMTQREGNLRAAEFAFPAHASLRQVVTILRTARPVDHFVTIPEGLTASQVFAHKIDNLSVTCLTLTPPKVHAINHRP